MKRVISIFLCLAFALSLTACKEEEAPSSQVPEISSIPEVSEVSSQPEEPEESPEPFVPAADLIPPVEVAPEDEEFMAAFTQNPVDMKYDADYAKATSFPMMRQACDEAAEGWKKLVEKAYNQALSVPMPAEKLRDLREEHGQWQQTIDREIEQIRTDAGEDQAGVLKAGRAIVLVYRDKAMELYKLAYEFGGELPKFN